MRSFLVSSLLVWFFLSTGCPPARGDGGTVVFAEKKGGYRFTVFCAPTPLRAGPIDISVLVQDESSGEPLPELPVTIRLTRHQTILEYPATTAMATNKTMQAAQFDLPESGRWALEVQVDGSHGQIVLGTELYAAEPLPRWLQLWPWFSWPLIVIALFAVQQRSGRRRGRLRPEPGRQ
jgi:hypothetical protein